VKTVETWLSEIDANPHCVMAGGWWSGAVQQGIHSEAWQGRALSTHRRINAAIPGLSYSSPGAPVFRVICAARQDYVRMAAGGAKV